MMSTMKNILKTVTILMSIFLLAGASLASAATAKVNVKTVQVTLIFDDKTLVVPEGQYIFSVNNSNYVPIRFISYALQKNVDWDPKSQTVIVSEPTKEQSIVLNERLMNAVGKSGQSSSVGGKKVAALPVQAKFVFDGEAKQLPDKLGAYNINGSIYVPVRFMSESVGTLIGWDGKTGTISGKSPAYVAKEAENGAKENQADQNGSTPVGNTGESSKPSYESITNTAEDNLYSLQNSCQNSLFAKLGPLKDAKTDTEQQKVIDEMSAIVDDCTVKFEAILSNTEKQLKSNGYSTAILAEYRKEFQAQLELGKSILGN